MLALFRRLFFKVFNFVYLHIKYFFIECFRSSSSIIVRSTAGINNKYFFPTFVSNIGDDLNIYLLSKITKKHIVPYEYSILGRKLYKKKNCLFIGSIITGLSTPDSIVIGSGVSPDFSKNTMVKPYIIQSVRGPLSQQYLENIGVTCPKIYGDPALVLPIFYTPQRLNKKYKIGFIPHFLDRTTSVLDMLHSYNSDDVIVLNVKNYYSIENFIDLMASCDLIISSSLHGLIFADAYNIPNVWGHFSFPVNHFKYNDYFKSVNRNTIEPVEIIPFTPIEKLLEYKSIWHPIDIDAQSILKKFDFSQL